jgi:hypothetical protein
LKTILAAPAGLMVHGPQWLTTNGRGPDQQYIGPKYIGSKIYRTNILLDQNIPNQKFIGPLELKILNF